MNTYTQMKEIYNDLLAKTEHYFKNIGISDAYIKEFNMVLTICVINDIKIEYPFYELSKIANYINNDINIKSTIGSVLQKHLINKNPLEIMSMLNIHKKITKHYQEFITYKMKSIFNYDSICSKIELCDIKFIMNKKTVDTIKIMNDTDVKILLELFCKTNNIHNMNNIKFYIDNKEMILNDKLIDYGISYENNIINVIILQKS